jgi:CCR4-NOT transcription complex subunit 1
MCSVFSQLRLLVANLTKKTYKQSTNEIAALVRLYGYDAQLHLLRCLVEEIDFRDQKSQKDQARAQLFTAEIQRLQDAPNFPSLLCQAIERAGSVQDDFLSHFVKTTKLPLAHQIALAVGLVQAGDVTLQSEGLKFMKAKVSDFCQSNQRSLHESTLHSVWFLMRKHEGFSKQLQSFTKSVKQFYPELYDSPLVAPFNETTLTMDSKRNLSSEVRALTGAAAGGNAMAITDVVSGAVEAAGLMEDLGYVCCHSAERLEEFLDNFPPLDESAVSKLLAMMARTHSGLPDGYVAPLNDVAHTVEPPSEPPTTWDVALFVQVAQKRSPELDWRKVIAGLDMADFVVPDAAALQMITTAWGTASKEPFPTELLLTMWHSRAGQISLLKQALSLEHSGLDFLSVSSTVMTVPPTLPAGGPLAEAWRSLDLIHVLLDLSQSEHTCAVHDIFDVPKKVCPELLLLSLAKAQETHDWCTLWASLSAELIVPHMEKSGPGSAVLLSELWNLCPSTVVSAMVSAYHRSPGTLTRTLDIAQELKALSLMIEMLPLPMAFELGVLASTRELLHLEKWLSERVTSNATSSFARAAVSFLSAKASASAVQHPEALACFWNALQPVMQQLMPTDQDILHNAGEKLKFAAPMVQLREETSAPSTAVNPTAVAPVAYPPPVVGSALPTTTPMQVPAPNPPPTSLPSQAQPSTQPPSQPMGIPNPDGVTGGDGEVTAPQGEAFPPDIEEEANSYFQKIFMSQQSIEEVINMLKGFKNSTQQREQNIFECMIHNLLDEYRFFPEYPDRELRITAVLFGSLIQHNLVTSVYLGIALSYILESLRNSQNKKMLNFGVLALEQFKSRLAEWPPYCQHIVQIPHIKQFRPEVAEWIQQARQRIMESQRQTAAAAQHPQVPQVQQPQQPVVEVRPQGQPQVQQPVGDQQGSVLPTMPAMPTTVKTEPEVKPTPEIAKIPITAGMGMGMAGKVAMTGLGGFGGASQLNIDTLVNARAGTNLELPEQRVQDTINFVLNNMTEGNLDQKLPELKAALSEKDLPYLAHYLVAKRASVELNNHVLYMAFIERIGIKVFYQCVLAETYHNVKALFQSDLIRTQSSERSLLKNLGSWLGSLTLAKNRPILYRDLNMKQLVLDAYERGLLIAVMPFVAKVLDATKHSRVFKPSQPWVGALLSLLCELHGVPELKLNLKFEVEVLFRNLNINLHDVQKTTLLHNRQPDPSGPDITPKNLSATSPGVGVAQPGDTASGGIFPGRPTQPYPNAQSLPEQTSEEDSKPDPPQLDTMIPNLSAYVNVNINLPLFQQQQHLQRFVPVAIDRAIREIISPVVERSVTIACITTRELILKDLATEPDENNIRKAGHLMVQNLAGSLALVTCKDPLRVSMGNHLRTLLMANMHQQPTEGNHVEQVVQFVSADNLELGCNIIEKAATDKAVRDIDDQLKPALTVRRKQREAGQPFYDQQQMMGRMYPASLPEFLHPKAGGVHPAQMRVYEDFARARQAPSLQQNRPGTGPNPTPHNPTQPQGAQPATNTAAPAQSNASAETGTAPQQPAQTPTQQPAQQPPAQQATTAPAAVESLTTQQALEHYNLIMSKVDQLVQLNPQASLVSLGAEHEIHALLRQIQQVVALSAPNREEVAVACAQKAFRQMYDNPFGEGDAQGLHADVQRAALVCLRDLSPKVVKELTQWLLFSEDERKLNQQIVLGLLRNQLIVVADYAVTLAKLMDNGRCAPAVEFAQTLVRTLVVEEKVVSSTEFSALLDVLNSLVQYGENPSAELSQLLEDVRCVSASSGVHAKERRRLRERTARNDKERQGVPPGLSEKVLALFEEWLEICDYGRAVNNNDKVYAQFISQLQQQGMVKGDDTTDHFFRTMVELAIENSIEVNQASVAIVNFDAVDAFSKLVVLLVKYLADPVNPSNTMTRVVLLNKVLAVIARVLLRDCDTRQAVNHQRPYFRLFSNLFVDLNAADPVLDSINLQVLGFFSNTLHSLQPSRVPGFTFAWLELISHRMFMPKLLMAKAQRGWPLFQRLLADLFKFLEPYLRGAELNEPIRLLYKGTLRVLLVLLHDFPEFLCDYHFSFCDVIPPSCIQMRNLILSAFPRNMRLPDPFTPNLKVDLLPEITQSPRILSKYTTTLSHNNLKADVDTFLKTRGPASFLQELRSKLLLPTSESTAAGTRYSAPMINALVLHVGVQAITQLQTKSVQVTSPSAPMDIFQWMANGLDTEGRYLFLNAIANQLRYPNNHTHYFSCVLLYLFMDASSETLKEQITRVLLERLIVNRPHPWGLLITFIELIKNPRYNFWNHSFTRCAPEIERLFESVARSCMGAPSQPSGAPGAPGAAADVHDA